MTTTAKGDHPQEKAAHMAHDIKNGAERIKKDVGETTDKVFDDLNELAHDVANKAGRQFRHMASDAGGKLSDARESVSGRIIDEPLKAVVIAAGVGFVLGALFRR